MTTNKSPLPVRPSASTTEALNSSENKVQGERAKKTVSQEAIKGSERKTGPSSRITIKYDVGFSNSLYIRGKGASLSWDKGQPLKNSKPDEWVWETTAPFTTCEFKVLINDSEYEIGDNHLLTCGASVHYTPKFC